MAESSRGADGNFAGTSREVVQTAGSSRGQGLCGPSSDQSLSVQVNISAHDCVLNRINAFYDGCEGRCVSDKTMLPLSHYEDLEQLVYGQIFPILVVLAVLANLAVALVLSKKHMVTPTNVVLRYMAIAELLVGLVPLPWTIFFFTMGNHERPQNLELWWCFLNKYSMDALPPIFHNIAMWLTVLLAGQRYISISDPLHSRGACTVSNVRVATGVIALFSLICGLPKSFDYFLDTVEGWIMDGSGRWTYIRACTTSPTPLLEFMGQTLFFNVYFWTRAIGFIILPSILLVVLNALLIKEIRKAQKRKQRLLREKRSEEAAKQRDSNSTSLMLVAIVSLFLVVNLPQALFMGVLCLCETFSLRTTFLDGRFPAVFLLSSNMLVMATYPINFSIYCFMSSSFRKTFKDEILCTSPQKDFARNRDMTVISKRSEYCSQLINLCETDNRAETIGGNKTSQEQGSMAFL